MTANFNPKGVSIILIGAESLTIACGDMLLAGGHRIAAVVSTDASVRAWAEGNDLTLLGTPRDLVGRDVSADWLLSVANLRILPAEVVALPLKGAINFHDGPLPDYAGLNTPAWAILNGETAHGVTWHLIEGGVDKGDILASQRIDIAADETALSLNSKCYAAGMESFAAVLAQLENDALDRQPQDLSRRRYFARDDRPAGDGLIDFSAPAEQVSARIRALDFGEYWNPLCRAKTVLSNEILAVGAVQVGQASNAVPGTITAVFEDRVTVATKSRDVTLSHITTLDGRRVDLRDFAIPEDTLAPPDHPALAVADEGFWRHALSETPLLPVPLAQSTGAERAERTISLTAPPDIPQGKCIAAAALVVLRSAGAMSGQIALAHGTGHPLDSAWRPLNIAASPDAPLTSVADALEDQLRHAAQKGPMPADLALRDPDCPVEPRAIALSLDGASPGDSVLTIDLSGNAPGLIYDASRLPEAAARVLARRLDAAFAVLSTATTCADVWALPEAEQTLLREGGAGTDTARDYRADTIHAALEAQAARTPEAEALLFEGEALTYEELNARANALAHLLRKSGAGAGTPIGLHTRRGPDLLIGAIAILKAGGAYLPIDPDYPAERIAHFIKDSAAPLIVTQSALADTLPQTGADRILIDSDPRLADADSSNPAPLAGPDDLAYLIYTSGSTGTPKGVMVSHRNVANFFAGMDDRIPLDGEAVWLALTSLSFDISVLELFWTLSRGVKVVLAGDESRTLVSNGPVAATGAGMDFNLMYWGNDDGVGPKKYELLLEGAKFADAHGFNAVWTPERHFHAFGGPYPNPSVTGAAVAAVTRNLAVRAGSCVAPLHHPARIAEEWGVIDNLTDGRIGLAIASGWQPDDFILRPENTPPANKPAMYETIDTLRRLWSGEAVEFPRADGGMHAVVTQPRPVSRKLPIWVTTAGNPQTWKEAGEIGANVLTHLLGQSIDEVAEKIRIYHAALRDAGHDPSDFTVTLMLHTYLAETREAAKDTARGPMKDYLRSAAALIKQYAWAFPAFKRPEGTTNPFDLDLDGLSAEELDAILDFAFERYFNDSGMFGTIADGVARADALRRIGVTEIACLIDYGIAPEKVLEGLNPLAEVLRQSNSQPVLAEDDFSIATQIVRHGVTHLQCTPSMAQMLVTNDEARAALGSLKQLMIGGEALPGALVKALRQATRANLFNMYGPTETTIWSTTHPVEDTFNRTAPIGRPIANTGIYVLDAGLRPCPLGVEGELWIGGDGVTQGYWQRAALTAERFVANPFGPGKLYRTGDLATLDADGVLHFGGRGDAQVKIRGHRIELGEIEARLGAVEGVTQAVAVAREGNGGAQIVGYVTAGPEFDADAARRDIARDLPAIMVPSAIVRLDAMPLTPNKKIDRKALPAPRPPRKAETGPVPARENRTEAAIADIWSGLLGIADIRGNDNFFSLGGHSLLAVQAHRDITSALGAGTLSITDIFRFPTLSALAAHIDKAGGHTTAPVAAPSASRTETMSKRRAMRAGRSKAGA